jgi:transporter family protein
VGRLAAVGLGLVSVVYLTWVTPVPTWQLLTIACLVLWGASGVSQKLSTNVATSDISFVWFAYAMIAQSIVTPFLAHVNWRVGASGLVLCIVGGTLNGLGAFFLFAAMAKGGKASVVTALSYLYPVVTIALSLLFLHESLSRTQLAGVALALIAAILMSMEKSGAAPLDSK